MYVCMYVCMYVYVYDSHLSGALAVERLVYVCDGVGQSRAVHGIQKNRIQILVVQLALALHTYIHTYMHTYIYI